MPDREKSMRKNSADPYRDIDFKGATRGAVVHAPPGTTKLSIRIDTVIPDQFRRPADLAAGGTQALKCLR